MALPMTCCIVCAFVSTVISGKATRSVEFFQPQNFPQTGYYPIGLPPWMPGPDIPPSMTGGSGAVGYCFNGAPAVARCFEDLSCGRNFYCDKTQRLCCPSGEFQETQLCSPQQRMKCSDGNDADSCCYNNLCSPGFLCTKGNFCCKQGTAASCNFESLPLGPCVLGDQCPTDFYCSQSKYCCRSKYPIWTR
ncbi:unnamed protein product [Soboliphyme baturini]|uniref:WAP domain-containing protein n=1 Tax=Soboliphyme baturini TaxID=241478 RepID=A0A183J5A4_9BILA|nr:unnamed protein product [Soboliphyme baturini]